MRIKLMIAALLLAGAVTPMTAQCRGTTDDTVICKVDTNYVRESARLFYEKKIVRDNASKYLWVKVRFANSADHGSEMFKLPENAAFKRGSLVATRDADPIPSAFKLLPEVKPVTELVARHDTLVATSFGLSNTRPSTKGLTMQAAICKFPSTLVAYADIDLR